MTDIKSLTLSELTQEMESIGEKKFRAAQIYSWLHERLVDDFDEMTNLSKGLREKLKENYELPHLTLVRVQTHIHNPDSLFASCRYPSLQPMSALLTHLAFPYPYNFSATARRLRLCHGPFLF